MGIEKLYWFLKRYSPVSFRRVPLSDYSGKRVAFDGNLFVYRFLSVSHRRVVESTDLLKEDIDHSKVMKTGLRLMMEHITIFIDHGITPIIIFDGKCPEEKRATQTKRQHEKADRNIKVHQVWSEISKKDILSRDESDLIRIRKAMVNNVRVTRVEIDQVKSVFTAFGIPVIIASGDGEKLAASLAIEGKVAAVYSTDSDLFPLGCPEVITDIEVKSSCDDGKKTIKAVIVNLKRILSSINCNFEQFVDFCIMSGCDFNVKIPKIGVMRAYGYMQEFKSLETFRTVKNVDIECLNHVRCREIFGFEPSKISSLEELEVKHIPPESKSIVELFDLDGLIDRLMKCYDKLPHPSRIFISHPPPKKLKLEVSTKKIDEEKEDG